MHWITTAATLRGDRPTNQDQLVVVDGAAAILDGATSWLHPYTGRGARDGGWYARILGQALTGRLPGHGTSLAAILAEAIIDVRDTHALTAGDSPYSTATIARWNTDHLDLLVLCDSPALIQWTNGKTDLVADDRLAATAPAERAAYREHLRHGHGFDTRFAGLIAEVQHAERRSFNQPDGFWVAETEPAASGQAVCRTVAAADVSTVVLMSDGAAAGVSDYQLTDWAAMADALAGHGESSWLQRIHAAEAADPDGHRWPRTKKHDDKTIVTLQPLDR